MSPRRRFVVPARLPKDVQRDLLARLAEHDPDLVALLREPLVTDLRQQLGAQALIDTTHPAVREWLAAEAGNTALLGTHSALTDGRA